MEYEQQITQLKGTLAVMVEIQKQQAEVQKMQAHSLVVHERRMNEMAEGQAIHDQRMAELRKMLAEGLALHEQRMNKLHESYALHEQRMNHIDMRLAEITDKLDGMIGFMDGFTRRPQ
jgi:HD-GYP domain-containing protein (c-di-GMP phosphodiesterase class II)